MRWRALARVECVRSRCLYRCMVRARVSPLHTRVLASSRLPLQAAVCASRHHLPLPLPPTRTPLSLPWSISHLSRFNRSSLTFASHSKRGRRQPLLSITPIHHVPPVQSTPNRPPLDTRGAEIRQQAQLRNPSAAAGPARAGSVDGETSVAAEGVAYLDLLAHLLYLLLLFRWGLV